MPTSSTLTLGNPSIFNGKLTSNLSGTFTTTQSTGSPYWLSTDTGTSTVTIGSPYWNTPNSTIPNYGYGGYGTTYSAVNLLKNLDYNAIFEIDDRDEYILSSNLSGIKKNKFLFNCNFLGNRIQPYELIMDLIEKKTKISVKIKISNILTICYTNLKFIKIENNFTFNTDCDFSELKVKFKYDNILFENHKLSKKEARADKLKKLNQE